MTRKCAVLGMASLMVMANLSGAGAQQGADVLIQGGTIYDGSADMKPYVGDVEIKDDRIVYVGPHATMPAARTIHAKGMIVSPGFIDAHTHPERFINSTDPNMREVPAWVMQGVSTLLIGVDGHGAPEIGDEFAKLKQQGVGTNIIAYVGFGAIRQRVLGLDDRAPTAAELATEKDLVAKGMCEGAVGFSTGLFYVPQSFSKTDEVIELAKEAGKRGGIYDTHTRDYSNFTVGYKASYQEALTIGKEAGMPVHLSHIKLIGPDVWGKSGDVIKMVNDARAAGQNVTASEYPYIANGSGLQALILPNWAYVGGYPAMIKRFNDPATLEKIKADMTENLRRSGGAHAVLLRGNQPWSNKYLDDVAKEWKVTPIDAVVRIMRQTDRSPIIGFVMSDVDVINFMKQPWTVTDSDGSEGHPRQYGTFPTKYRDYVVKKKVISLPFFIRSSTGMEADIFGIKERGYLKPGYFADVVVFDPKTYAPKSDFVHWDVPAEGVMELFVNGKPAVDNGKMTTVLSGRPLPHTPPAGTCN